MKFYPLVGMIGEISDDISKMVQDKVIVTIYGLSNSTDTNDLEWAWRSLVVMTDKACCMIPLHLQSFLINVHMFSDICILQGNVGTHLRFGGILPVAALQISSTSSVPFMNVCVQLWLKMVKCLQTSMSPMALSRTVFWPCSCSQFSLPWCSELHSRIAKLAFQFITARMVMCSTFGDYRRRRKHN